MFRLQAALLPEIVERQAGLLAALLGDGALDRRDKERVMLTVSGQQRSRYGMALHGQMLKLLGAGPGESDGALPRFTAKLMGAPEQIDAADIDCLRQSGLTDPQILEAIVTAGFCRFLNTLQAGLGAQPDFAIPPAPAAPPQKNLHPPRTRPRPNHEPIEGAPQPVLDAPDPDGELVSRARSGDLDAFENLVKRHSERIYRMLVSLLGDADQAMDAMQDTFLKAFQSLGQFEGRSKFSTWLMTIANNTGMQTLRQRRPSESLDDGDWEDEGFRPRQVRAWTDDPEQQLSKSETRQLVERHILRLPVKYRVVVMLRDVEQLSTEEAAAALGLGIPALKARLVRGRLMLREALAPHFSASGAMA